MAVEVAAEEEAKVLPPPSEEDLSVTSNMMGEVMRPPVGEFCCAGLVVGTRDEVRRVLGD